MVIHLLKLVGGQEDVQVELYQEDTHLIRRQLQTTATTDGRPIAPVDAVARTGRIGIREDVQSAAVLGITRDMEVAAVDAVHVLQIALGGYRADICDAGVIEPIEIGDEDAEKCEV